MAFYKLGFVAIVLCLGIHLSVCQNTNDTQTTSDGTPSFEKTALEKGIEPIFRMYQRFLKTVMPENFYDSGGNTAFSFEDLFNITKSGDFAKLQSEWQDVAKTFGGMAACIIVGMIFFLVMPIVGLFFCCCYCCCNKCGATKEIHDPQRAKCKRVIYVSLLLVFATMMLVGAIISLLGAELLHRSLKNENNEGMVGRLENSLQQFGDFANDSLNEVKTTAKTKVLDRAIPQMLKEVTTAIDNTVQDIMTIVNATSVFESARDLGKEANSTLKGLDRLSASLGELQTLQTNISAELSDIKNSIDVNCGSQCAINTSSLTFNNNYSSLGDLQLQVAELSNAQQITSFTNEAEKQFDNVKNEVNGSVNSNLEKATNEVDKVKSSVDDGLKEFDKAFDVTSAFDNGASTLRDADSSVKEYEKYSWYVFVALGCTVLLPVLFYYLGVLFGLCGERPTASAACCNKGSGSNFLVAGICCSFLFASIVMMVVILLFSLGGTAYLLSCQYVNDGVENVQTFEPIVNKIIGENPLETTLNTSFGAIVKKCKDNNGLYTALNLEFVFNLDTLLNLTDIEAQLRTLNDAQVTVGNITILNPGLVRQLRNYGNFSLGGVNFTTYTAELDKTELGFDLTGVITQLQNANQTTISERLMSLQDIQLKALTTEKDKLRRAVGDLQGHSNVTDKVEVLITNIEASQNDFNSRKNDIINQAISSTVDNMIRIIVDLVADLKLKVKNDTALCRPVYDSLQSISDAVCVVTLDPINCIWFGLGWSLFFYIPCFIFAALLSSLYKRQEPYKKKQDFEDRHPGGYDGYGHPGDNIPLTSSNTRGQVNGKHNAGYHDSADQGRANKGVPQNQSPNHHEYSEPYRPSGGPSSPYNGGYEAPPRYDDVQYQGGRPSAGYH